MQWTVEAANPNTGQDQALNVEAQTAEAAEQHARSSGWLVSRVYPAVPASPPTTPRPPATGNGPLSYAPSGPAAHPVRVPHYRDIGAGAVILRIFSWFLIIVGLLAIVAGIVMGVTAAQHSYRLINGVAAGAGPFGAGVGLIITATFLRMYAALAVAVRDIAQNSFRP